MLEVKFESNINTVIEEMADHGNVDSAAIQETLETQPQELSEGKSTDVIGQSDKKHANVPEEAMLAKKKKKVFILKELSEIHDSESTKGEMWVADPNFRKCGNLQDIEKILALYYKFLREKKASTFQISSL